MSRVQWFQAMQTPGESLDRTAIHELNEQPRKAVNGTTTTTKTISPNLKNADVIGHPGIADAVARDSRRFSRSLD